MKNQSEDHGKRVVKIADRERLRRLDGYQVPVDHLAADSVIAVGRDQPVGMYLGLIRRRQNEHDPTRAVSLEDFAVDAEFLSTRFGPGAASRLPSSLTLSSNTGTGAFEYWTGLS